jgi:hypothetical protein
MSRTHMRLMAVALLLLASCAPSRTYLIFVPFSSTAHPEVNLDVVREYKSRLDLPGRYEEIGVIKLEGKFSKQDVFATAAKNGADAIIYEANNAVLFRLIEKSPKEKESTNAKTI